MPPSDPLGFLEAELDTLRSRDLLRSPRIVSGGITLCSNDYLGLGALPFAENLEPSGAGASALVTGFHAAHAAAEEALALWVRLESALLFSSGYSANVGVLSALAGPGDLIVSDELNHASIIDGCRLSRAKIAVFPHADVAAARDLLSASGFRRKFLVTESYFGMDATRVDLAGLRAVADAAGAVLIVDEAHALGVFGAEGAGLCALDGVRADVLVGTLGKAVGLHGAFAAGSPTLRLFLWNRARSFVFSTASSPAHAAAIPGRIVKVRAADGERRDVLALSESIRDTLRGQAIGVGHIIPWVLGEPARALAAQSALSELGIVGLAIRPPTVPIGKARVRLAARAGLSSSERGLVLNGLERVIASTV